MTCYCLLAVCFEGFCLCKIWSFNNCLSIVLIGSALSVQCPFHTTFIFSIQSFVLKHFSCFYWVFCSKL